ncbi:TetR/AcrR family transcriptional regulator [Arsenicicoccus dermatophilus]|uniref:TetR/AcrR family transcriptional regulator n=1 Tax=Arsenicicoccus dermatophilus TaxID=1076331 RepID=UPI003916E0E7
MAANPARRAALADAAVRLLGAEGGRALTHRAVDTAAGVPTGTCANYFPTRAELMVGLAERIFTLLAPDASRLAELAAVEEGDAAPAYLAHVVERLLAHPHLATALVELRLEAARTPAVAARLAPFLQAGLDDDVAFHTARGLPGGRETVVLLHHVAQGIVLDALTVPLDPACDPREVAQEAARRLVRADGHRR